MNKSADMDDMLQEKPGPVVGPGEFVFASAGLEHGHIHGMTGGLIEAGATLRWVHDPDPEKVTRFRERFPQAKAARTLDEILDDGDVRLVAAAAVPCDRCELGLRVMEAGKDYFTDKGPMTTLEQLERARAAVGRTGRKYAVYYGERLHCEGAVYAGQLIERGAIGRVLQVINLAPHRLSASDRPGWFWDKSKVGGILTDIGSHQVEQFLFYARATDARVDYARVANLDHPRHPGFEDFGEAALVAGDGASQYLRVDWFTPDGSSVWGDGRLFILGTGGTIEVRKHIDVAHSNSRDHVFLVNDDGERHVHVEGKVGFPYFGALIRDCLYRTETAMTQAHAFKAAEVTLKAQEMADGAKQK
jgi:predicted dehydrogenase